MLEEITFRGTGAGGHSMAKASGKSSPSRLREWTATPRTDVLIIGGGINGLAVFRELALQGVSVTLVEKADYCSGASAASSHMIHGGIRYLENGEIRLVRESLLERNRLLKNAPHYVKPLKTTIPIFSLLSGLLSAPFRLFLHRSGKPKERGALLIKVGLMLYDTFGRDGGTMPRHQFFGRKKTLELMPEVNRDVQFSAHYYDAAIENPERLAIDLLQDGLECGDHARAMNYVKAAGFSDGGVTLEDELTGETLTMEASLIVNTSGPWTDLTNQGLGLSTRYMGGTKGSHIVLDNPELFRACNSREIFFENSDGRIVLMYPLLGRVLVGTTDIPVDDPENVECTEEEVDYFFDLVGHVFPHIALDRSQIVFRYSGVRPLPAAGDLSPGVISRDYRLVEDSLGGTPVVSLVGGKWTTFRAIGENLADTVLETLGVPRKYSTESLSIGGGKDFPTTEQAVERWIDQHGHGRDRERVRQLLDRYGTGARRLLDHLGSAPETPLQHTEGYSREEIEDLVRHEAVFTLSDLIFRRTTLGFRGEVQPASVKELADILASVRSWNTADTTSQVNSIKVEGALAA